jgi:rubrerythrin
MGYQQLKEILDENRRIAEQEAQKPITECPECGFVPLKENRKGEKLCPICGWRSN